MATDECRNPGSEQALPSRRQPGKGVVIGLLLGVLLAWFLWPLPSYERAKVHASLQALAQPYRAVVTEYYMDGGSVGIQITDRNGRVMEYALPVSEDNPRRYEQVFFGAMWIKDRSKSPVEVKDPTETKKMLIRIIDRYSPRDANTGAALCALRGLPRDYASALAYAFLQQWRADSSGEER